MRIPALALSICLLAAPVQALTIEEAHQLVLPQAHKAEFHFARDSWLGYDKFVEHGIIPFLATVAVDRVTNANSQDAEIRVFLWMSAAYLANEIKDGFGGWEQSHLLGDGFSLKDQVWAEGAIALALLLF